MLQPQRLHGSAAGPSSAVSDSDSDQGLFDSDWGWSSSGSDGTIDSSDDEEGGRRALRRHVGRHVGSNGGAPAASLAQHPLTLRFQAAEVEAQFGRYQAACLHRVDALAYLFVLLIFGCAEGRSADACGFAACICLPVHVRLLVLLF